MIFKKKTDFIIDWKNNKVKLLDKINDLLETIYNNYLNNIDQDVKNKFSTNYLTLLFDNIVYLNKMDKEIKGIKSDLITNSRNLNLRQLNNLNKIDKIIILSFKKIDKSSPEIVNFAQSALKHFNKDIIFRTIKIANKNLFNQNYKATANKAAWDYFVSILNHNLGFFDKIKEGNQSKKFRHFINNYLKDSFEKYSYIYMKDNLNENKILLEIFNSYIQDNSLIIFNDNLEDRDETYLNSIFNNEKIFKKLLSLKNSITLAVSKDQNFDITLLRLIYLKNLNSLNEIFDVDKITEEEITYIPVNISLENFSSKKNDYNSLWEKTLKEYEDKNLISINEEEIITPDIKKEEVKKEAILEEQHESNTGIYTENINVDDQNIKIDLNNIISWDTQDDLEVKTIIKEKVKKDKLDDMEYLYFKEKISTEEMENIILWNSKLKFFNNLFEVKVKKVNITTKKQSKEEIKQKEKELNNLPLKKFVEFFSNEKQWIEFLVNEESTKTEMAILKKIYKKSKKINTFIDNYIKEVARKR